MSSRARAGIAVFVLLLAIGLVLYLYFRPKGEASTLQSSDRVSLFVYPDKVSANDADKAKIIATVRRKQKPLSGINIFFSTSFGTLSNQQVITDGNGEAVTYLSSPVIGQATVTAVAGQATKTANVQFIGAR